MNKTEKIQALVKLLEKTTGKKITTEVIEGRPLEQNLPLNEDGVTEAPAENVPTLSKRQLGAQQAIKTKGFDDWSEEQYALAYWLVVYKKRSMPEPYNNMPIDQIAEDAGMKKSTLSMAFQRIQFMINGEGMTTGGPKIEGYVKKFENLPEEQLKSIMMKAFENSTSGIKTGSGNIYKNADFATKKKKSVPADPEVQQTEFLNKINAQRIRNGQKPYFLRNGKPVTESKIFPWIKKRIETTVIDAESKAMVESIIRQSNNNIEKETITALKAATKYSDPIKNIARYKVAKQLQKEHIANVFLSDVNDFFNTLILKETVNKLSTFTESNIKLNGEDKPLNEQKLNEFFTTNAYDKFLSLLARAEKVTESLRFYAAYYPEPWEGNESQVVQEKLKTIFKNFTQGSGIKKKSMLDKISDFAGRDATENPDQQAAFPGLRKFATEAEKKNNTQQLNEWFAKGKYKTLLRTLDACAQQADKVHELMAGDKAKLKADAKEVLGKIKHVWKTFNITETSGENVTYAGDAVNKLSHKPYEKEMAKKAAMTPAPEPKPEKKSFMQKAKDMGGKVVGGLKKAGSSLANSIADQFSDEDTSEETVHEGLELEEGMFDDAKKFADRDSVENGNKPAFKKLNKFAKNEDGISTDAVGTAKKFAGIDARENPGQKPAFPKIHKFATESVDLKEEDAIPGTQIADKLAAGATIPKVDPEIKPGSLFHSVWNNKEIKITEVFEGTHDKKGIMFVTFQYVNKPGEENISTEQPATITLERFKKLMGEGKILSRNGHVRENLDQTVQQPGVMESKKKTKK